MACSKVSSIGWSTGSSRPLAASDERSANARTSSSVVPPDTPVRIRDLEVALVACAIGSACANLSAIASTNANAGFVEDNAGGSAVRTASVY